MAKEAAIRAHPHLRLTWHEIIIRRLPGLAWLEPVTGDEPEVEADLMADEEAGILSPRTKRSRDKVEHEEALLRGLDSSVQDEKAAIRAFMSDFDIQEKIAAVNTALKENNNEGRVRWGGNEQLRQEAVNLLTQVQPLILDRMEKAKRLEQHVDRMLHEVEGDGERDEQPSCLPSTDTLHEVGRPEDDDYQQPGPLYLVIRGRYKDGPNVGKAAPQQEARASISCCGSAATAVCMGVDHRLVLGGSVKLKDVNKGLVEW